MEQLQEQPRKTDRTALGWFGLGVLVGAVALAGLFILTGALRPGSSAAAVDLGAVREAARQGVSDALLANPPGTAQSVDMKAVQAAAKAGAQEALQAAQNGAQDNADSGAVDPEAAKKVATRERNTLGPVTATVTLIEFSDYQCPYCLRFHTTVYPDLVKKYVDTGRIKFSFKHFPFLSEASGLAAQAAECAADQGHFWEYHEYLYKLRESTGALNVTKDALIQFAEQLKLDKAAFGDCLNNDTTLVRVQADADEGQKLGVRGTPSFLIGGKLLVGAQPLSAFEAAIDAALAAGTQQ